MCEINQVPNASIITSNNSLYGLAGIKAAYGISSIIGFKLSAELGHGETIQRELENKWFSILRFNSDLNFMDIIKAPISMSLGYLFSSYPKNNNDNIFSNNIFLPQINYICRTNIVLSLDIAFNRELIGTDANTVWMRSTMFSMRYLF